MKVDYANYPGVPHEFFGMGAVLPDAKRAVKQGADGLKRSFQAAAHASGPSASAGGTAK